MSIFWIMIVVIFGYAVPGYYFCKWEINNEKEIKGYCTLGQVLIYTVFAMIPVVNIILFLIVGIAAEKIFPKRFY